MRDTNTLTILQYNVRKSAKGTLIPLLADEKTKNFDIIAIQEPWKNPTTALLLNPYQSGFHLLYKSGGDTRVCFYINEKIDPESWDVEYPTEDLCTLNIEIRIGSVLRKIHIHNIYNPSPLSISATDSPSTLPAALRQLNGPGEHILLGDFNLHHPHWGGARVRGQHEASEQLLDIIESKNLSLTLPRGTVTWEARNSFSTIDLVFMTEDLVERLEHCITVPELNQDSDHVPISTRLRLTCEPLTPPRRRAWKLLDMNKLREVERNAPTPRVVRGANEIDAYTADIQDYLKRIVQEAVPWAKPSPQAKSFWNRECEEATKETRRLRRIWTAERNLSDWKNYIRMNDKKQKIIGKARNLHFREQMAEVAASRTGLFRLAKWGKDRSDAPREIPKMPPLATAQNPNTIADTFEKRVNMLKKSFFPPPPNADLGDLVGYSYPPTPECPALITEEEVAAALRKPKPDKAPGPDGITNRILKACSENLIKLLTPLFQACVNEGYHPKVFKIANTITLKKPGKGNYTDPKAWRPIALLNTLGKALESIIARKISHLTEEFKLIPDTQMGARPGRGTETALELLTEQVHTVWNQGNDKVASLLSIDVSGAFDTVSHRRLIHNMRKRKIPEWIAKWTDSFLKERETTLTINQRTTNAFPLSIGIPQGSPLSPILYLFYNADLLDICNRPSTNAAGIGFVDDVNILTYGKSTEENCKTLKEIHENCERWAKRHGSVFAPHKYELIHLAKNPKKFNLEASFTVNGKLLNVTKSVRVLGVYIDTRLNWSAHYKEIQKKMTRQTRALTRIAAATWGATLLQARHVYTAVVRPAMTHGSLVWHTPEETQKHVKVTRKSKLEIVQNKCLRVVAGAYRATPIEVLQAETFICPLTQHLDHLQAKGRSRLQHNGQAKVIEQACEKIRTRLKGKRGRQRIIGETPGARRQRWVAKLTAEVSTKRKPKRTPPWEKAENAQEEKRAEYAALQRERDGIIAKRFKEKWKDKWIAYQSIHTLDPTIAQSGPLHKNRLNTHKLLNKAQSSLAIQIRTEKIGLASFLFKRKVPDIESAACLCGSRFQTAKHVIMFCGLHNRIDMLRAAGSLDYQKLITDPKAIKIITAWLMRTGILTQYTIAAQMTEQ